MRAAIWIGRADSLSLVKTSVSGDTLLRVETTHRRPSFTAAQEDAIRRANDELGRQGAFTPILSQALHGLDGGRLLVQIGRNMTDPGHELDLFDAEGRLLGTVVTDLAIHHRSRLGSRADTLVLPVVGEFDVPVLVKAVLERDPT